MGVRISPLPSAHALWPLTNTGTSAPRVWPISRSSLLGSFRFHKLLSAIKTVAAFELSPPRPPPLCIFLMTPPYDICGEINKSELAEMKISHLWIPAYREGNKTSLVSQGLPRFKARSWRRSGALHPGKEQKCRSSLIAAAQFAIASPRIS